MTRVIVFDFDGVIVDSNALKHNAFFNLFSENDREVVAKVLSRKFPRTRFEIIQEIFDELKVPRKQSGAQVVDCANRYNNWVQAGIVERGVMPGALETLSALAELHPLYINSATPELALRESIARLNIGHFFRGVYGRLKPEETKSDILKRIIEKENKTSGNLVMIGDSEADYQSSREVGCYFVGVANDFNGWSSVPFPLITQLSMLKGVIDRL